MVVAAVAVLNYAVATGMQPCLVSDGPLAPERAEGWRNDPHEVPIHDGRRAVEPLGLDDAGFVLVQHAGGADGAGRPGRERSFAKAEAIARAATGATRVVAFDWTLRSTHPLTPDNTAVGAPVLRVHNDFTPRSALETLRHVLPDEFDVDAGPGEAVARAGRRYAIVSVWRPVGRPVSAWPLALADARTVADDDLLAVLRRYPNARGETGFVAYRPAHRWFTFPRMQVDEAVVFKLFDSAPGVARWTPHSAFREPGTPEGAPARESVEVRVAVVYAVVS